MRFLAAQTQPAVSTRRYFIQDEAAHIPEGEKSLDAVLPSQARIISISTAAPGWFGDACGL